MCEVFISDRIVEIRQCHLYYLFVTPQDIVDLELAEVEVWTLVSRLMSFSLNS